jgi:Glycosyl transferase family 2
LLNPIDKIADDLLMPPNTSADPVLTVVTICRNVRADLECTVSSVLTTSASNQFEYLVIDGDSSDGTRDFLAGIADTRLSWLSEPDSGISSAMNKGTDLANGTWIMHLHAGDRLVEGGLDQILALIAKYGEQDIICSAIVKEEPSGDVICEAAPERLTIEMAVPHPGVVARTEVWRRLGGFDESLRNAMDYDLLLRAWLTGARFVTCHEPVSRFAAGGQSDRSLWKTLSETHQIRRTHLTSGWSRWLIFLVALWTKGQIRIGLQGLGFSRLVSWHRDRFAYPRKTAFPK